MMFMLRSVFWLGLVFAIAPGDDSDPRKEAGARAANAAFQGAAAIASRLPEEAEKLCRKAPADCLMVASAAASAKPGPKQGVKPAAGKAGQTKPSQRPSAARDRAA